MATYKVIGVGEHRKYFDENAYRDTLRYIFDPNKAVYIGGSGISSPKKAAEEMQNKAAQFGKDSGKRVRHSVVSFRPSEGVSLENAKLYAQRIIQYYAPDYQIAYAVHGNTDEVHIHFVMNQIGLDGSRYQGKKHDYYNFINYIQSVTHLPVIPSKK